jgi:hypothetical protein
MGSDGGLQRDLWWIEWEEMGDCRETCGGSQRDLWWIEWEEMVVDCTETGGGFAERLVLD